MPYPVSRFFEIHEDMVHILLMLKILFLQDREGDDLLCGASSDFEPSLSFSNDLCVYSNSRNDVPRVAQPYGTIAARTRRRASVLGGFVVLCVHVYSFAGLIRRTPPPMFSDTDITVRHSDTTIYQLRAHWVRISWSFEHVPPVGKASTLSTRSGSPRFSNDLYSLGFYTVQDDFHDFSKSEK